MKFLSGALQIIRNLWLPIFGGLVALMVITWPAVPQLSTHLVGDGGDTYQYAGFQQLVALNMADGQWPFASTQAWRYPAGIEFARAQDGTFPNLVGGLLLLISNQPTLSYNLTVLGLLMLNFLAGYALAVELGKSKLLGLVGGLGIGFSFYNLARAAGHLNLLGTGGFCLLLLSLIRLQKKITWPNLALLGLGLAWLTLSSFQYVAVTAILVILLGPLWLALTGRPAFTWLLKWRHHWGKLVALAVAVLMVTSPFLLPLVQAFLAQDFISHHQATSFSPPLVSYLLPDAFLPVNLSQLNPIAGINIEHVVFIGWLELVALVGFSWRFRHQLAGRLIGMLSGVLFILSLGVALGGTQLAMPYALVSDFFPFSAVPETGRYMFFVQILSVIALVLWLKQIKALTRRRLATGLVLLGLLFERLSWGQFYQLQPESIAFVPSVQASAGQAVLDVPLNRQRVSAYPWLYQKAVLDGEAHWIGNTNDSLSFLEENGLVDFKCDPAKKVLLNQSNRDELLARNQALLDTFKEVDIRTLVVHTDSMLLWPRCQNVLARVQTLIPSHQVATETLASSEPAQLHWAGSNLETGLFFPRAGSIRVNGFSLEPAQNSLELKLADQPIYSPIDQFFDQKNTPSTQVFQLKPDQGQLLRVEAGDTLKVVSPDLTESGVLTIWYTYQPDVHSNRSRLENEDFVLLYSDAFKQVWQLK